jgi:MraZ protein
MFIGEYSHAVDNKGRVSLPAKFRRNVTEGVVVTRGFDHCLFVYPRNEWQVMAQKLASLPVSQKKNRAMARLILAGAWDVELDSQGRIMLAENLRKYAEITKHVIIAGLYNRIEIWDENTWNDYKAKTEAAGDDIAESMGDLGI